jgi:sporulation protein YqfC
MSKAAELLTHIAEGLDLPPEAAAEPQLLLTGRRQVRVEGHRGIRRYSPERIEVRTGRGCARIDGQGLRVCFLSPERLVVRGKISAVTWEDAP